ncbi:MAG: FAD-binding oxidoreductase [Arenicellales bacterium]|nr:FAD-binding oxidoreductase [Arenicellales bacterium]
MTQTSSRITIDTPIRFRDFLPEQSEVVIIGAGVIGIFTALYLARMGKCVFVCEKGRVAGEQSSRNWGWIRTHGRDEAEVPIASEAGRLWREVDTETNGACGVKQIGTVYLASSDSEMEELVKWLPIAENYGLDTRALSASEVQDLFAGGSTHRWVGGTCTMSDYRGEPWTAVPAVAELARAVGAGIRENCAVRVLDIAAGRIQGVITEEGRIKCEQVVLAGGAWSSLFAHCHGIQLPQLSIRATVAQTAPAPEVSQFNCCDEELAWRRRADGGYTLARTGHHGFFLGPDAFRHFWKYMPVVRREWRKTNPRLASPHGYPDGWRTPRKWEPDEQSPLEDTRVLEPMADRSYVTQMGNLFAERFQSIGRPNILDSWAGMIDTMPDVVPVIDRVPTVEGMIIATGMSGHGFGIGPGFGRVIADIVAGYSLDHDMTRFRLSRFTDGSKLVVGSSY